MSEIHRHHSPYAPMGFTTPTGDVLDALDSAEFDYVRHPVTGEILYDQFGQPQVYPVPAATKLSRVAKKWLYIGWTVTAFVVTLMVLFVIYVALQVYLPPDKAAALETIYTFIVHWIVFSGLTAACLGVAWALGYCIYHTIRTLIRLGSGRGL